MVEKQPPLSSWAFAMLSVTRLNPQPFETKQESTWTVYTWKSVAVRCLNSVCLFPHACFITIKNKTKSHQ